MLYVSTKNKGETSTAYKTLHERSAADGGMFAPLSVPSFNENDLAELYKLNGSRIIAHILNLFFSQQITHDNVESCIGKDLFKLQMLSQRTVVAELWDTEGYNYEQLVDALYCLLCDGSEGLPTAPQWARVVIEIAVLTAIFAELSANGIDSSDIVVESDNFTYVMAAWYARKMGLPIGGIICACNRSCDAWELINHGKIWASSGMQQLVYETLGVEYVREGSYQLSEEALPILNQGMSAAVVSEGRIDAVLSSVFRTNNYIADPSTAVSFGALQDHRACTGENRCTLIMSRQDPLPYVARISSATGCSQEKLKSMIRISEE